MLFLNQWDMKEAMTMKETIDAIDLAYKIYESNNFQMPTRMQVIEGENTLVLMPCMTSSAIGTKLVTVFPKNTSVPTLHSLVILNSSDTGEIKAILDGSFLTGFRTGAIGGSAVRHLAKADVQSLAVIGTGVQGLYQAIAVCTERSITDIYLYNRTNEKIPPFIEQLKQWIKSSINFHTCQTVEEAIENAEIVVTATTSEKPVLPDKQELLIGKLFIGIGSFQSTMREFPDSLYKVTKQIIVDSEDAVKESGDIIMPLKHGWIDEGSIITMSQYLYKKGKRNNDGNSVVFKSTGMALFDVVTANMIYQRAVKKGLGTKLNLA